MSNHHIVIEEDNYEDKAFKAFCDCGWSGDHWIHSDSFISDCDGDWQDAEAAAENEATDEGNEHLDEAAPTTQSNWS